MLVLTRYPNESIMIGDSVKVTVVDILGETVRLTIAAPCDVAVHRKEACEATEDANRQVAVGDVLENPQDDRAEPRGGPVVLTRRVSESVLIGETVEVCVVHIREDRVRLGVTCPPDVPIHRQEVYDAIRRQYREDI